MKWEIKQQADKLELYVYGDVEGDSQNWFGLEK